MAISSTLGITNSMWSPLSHSSTIRGTHHPLNFQLSVGFDRLFILKILYGPGYLAFSTRHDDCPTRNKLSLRMAIFIQLKRDIYGGIAMVVAFIALINIVAMAQVSEPFWMPCAAEGRALLHMVGTGPPGLQPIPINDLLTLAEDKKLTSPFLLMRI